MDVTCASSEYAYEICTHVVNMLDPATSRPQSLRAILLSLAPPHPTPPPHNLTYYFYMFILLGYYY